MMKSLTLRPFAFLALAGLFYGCQQEELVPAPSSIKINSQAAVVVAENCDVLDFEDPARFPRDVNGYITGAVTLKGGVIGIKGVARKSDVPITEWGTENRANIFNTTDLPDGHPDWDLETPNWNNTPSLGNILIVQELVAPYNVASVPNDNAHGGILELDFSKVGPVTFSSMDVIDIEAYLEERTRVDFYDAANNKLNSSDILITPTGDNGVGKITFPEIKGVMKMVITLDGSNPTSNAGSGGIDNISFCKDIPPAPVCGPCDGKIDELTFKYNGANNATLIASVKVGFFFLPIAIIKDLDAGETFTLSGTKNPDRRPGFAGTLGTDLVMLTSSPGKITTTSVHTSCSQPIFDSYDNGLFTTISGSSKNGGELCDFEPAPEKECPKNRCEHKCVKKCYDHKGKKKCEHKCSSNHGNNNDYKSWSNWGW